MKLKQIAEGKLYQIPESRRNWSRGDQIAIDQSSKNLVITALTKIRNMLGPMGLVKGGRIQGHKPIEPIPIANTPFLTLRKAVKSKVQRDSAAIQSGKANPEQIGQFWGFQFPTSWTDIIGQHGKTNVQGTFDGLIRQTIAQSEGQPGEVKADLLNRLATQIV